MINWWLLCGLTPVAWFWQNLSHELSHLIVGWLVEGRKPIKLIPWPHKNKDRFYFARYECGRATKNGKAYWRHYAPLFNILIFFLAMTVSLSFVISPYFIPFMVCNFVDFCVWEYGYFFDRPYTDGQKFRDSLKD